MPFFQKILRNAHYQKFEEKRLKYLFRSQFNDKSLLDIGCGQGRNLELLRPYCSKISGIDINPEQIQALKNKGFDVFLPNELPDEKYDILLMSHVVEHLSTTDLIRFIENYLPLLKEDGHLIILTPMPGIRFWHDYTHVRPYTPQSFGMLFGIINAPAEFSIKIKMQLDDIYFFKDSWRIRNNRSYFRFPNKKTNIATSIPQKLIAFLNILGAGLHIISNGYFGTLVSWMGIYKKKN